MDFDIVYTHNRNGYVKIKDGKIIIEIPFFLKFDNKFKNSLIEKGKVLLEKYNKKTQIQVADEETILIFGESVEKTDLKKNINKELKNILIDYVTPLVQEYSSKLGYKYKKIRVGKAKTKWGSCSYDQVLMFNINLIHLPTKFIRYVVVHEVCHLKHKNHSKDFWNEVGFFLPDYKETKKELRNIIIN